MRSRQTRHCPYPLNKPTCYFPTPPSVHSGTIVPRPSMTLAILRRENRKLACVHSTVLPLPTESTFVFIGHSLLLVFILLSLLIAHVCTRDKANEISTCLFKSGAPSLSAGHPRDPRKTFSSTCQCSNPIRHDLAWHLISLRVLEDTVTWDHDMEPSNDTTDTITTTIASLTQFDQQLLTATRLKVHFKTDSADTSHISQALTTAIQNFPTWTQQRIRTLYHLDEVQGLFRHFHHDMFRPLQHLTTLHVITNGPYYHNLDGFFLTFPNLEELVLGQNPDFTRG